jgi:hypothetical protein
MLSHHPIFVVFVAAVIAPLLAETRPGARVPVVVFEILLGILIGPHVLHVVDYDSFLSKMRTTGMLLGEILAKPAVQCAPIDEHIRASSGKTCPKAGDSMIIPLDFKLTGTNHGYNRGRKQKETRYFPS